MAVRGVVMVLAIVVAAGCGTGEPAGDDAGSRGHRVQHLAFAGPAFAGRALVWGEEYRDGSLAVIRQRPGRRAQVVHRIATPPGRDRERSFLGLPGALSASSKWIVYGLDTAKVTVDGDLVVHEPHSRAFGTYGGGPFRELLPGCGDAAYVATATEADAVAIAQVGGSCGGEYATRVWVIEGGAGPRLVYRAPGARLAMRQVQLAGRWIAWSEGGSGAGDKRITVADRASGNIAARLTPGDFAGGTTFSAFDIDAAGNVVALSGPQPRCYYVCVTWRRPIGDLAMTDDRIAWAVLGTDGDLVPGAPGTIRRARLPSLWQAEWR